MAQSDKDRLDELEKRLATLVYRVTDLEKDIDGKVRVITTLLELLAKRKDNISSDEPETIEVQRLGSPEIEKLVVNKQQKKFDGEGCSCSPIGMPHSINCKGYFSGPSYEDLRDKITRYENL